ncbi:hypothetical protein GCM10022397_35330 [Flavivirga jejuensis]
MFIVFINKTNAQGPNAPEAASFEPVDATDMVNLVTGDLSYVLPLLNVPSPEGGYPITLSYHAGIAMGQEASWVGLGWSINPGAINRSVNGYPDDWEVGKVRNLVYNNIGTATSYYGSIGVGINNNNNVGLYGSYTEAKGFGGTNQYSFDIGGYFSSLKNTYSLGTNGVGYSHDVFEAAGKGGVLSKASIGANYNWNNGAISGSFKGNKSSIGINFNSTGYSVSILGKNIGGNNGGNTLGAVTNVDKISFQISGQFKMINFSFGYSKDFYWAYDSEKVSVSGVLYSSGINENLTYSDSYEMMNVGVGEKKIKNNNLSSFNLDNFSVSSQGLLGNITPKFYEKGTLRNSLVGLNVDNNGFFEDKIDYMYGVPFTKHPLSPNNRPEFYFDNINASYIKSEISKWNANSTSYNSILDIENSYDLTTILNISDTENSNYNAINKRIIKGPFVEYFINSEIANSYENVVSRGFIEAKEFDRFAIDDNINTISPSIPLDGIGAFSITSSDGKTYHYSLPVYHKEFFKTVSKKDDDVNEKFYRTENYKPYATHWLLTAITGPDYFDSNDNGRLDKDDYGYWVEFEYGKWLDNYTWSSTKSPSQFNYYEDSKSHSFGIKEVYYLDKIRTRDHIALFIKEERLDNLSAQITFYEDENKYKVFTNNIPKVILVNTSEGPEVIGRPELTAILRDNNISAGTGVYTWYNFYKDYIKIKGNNSTLRLKEILLFANDPENDLAKDSSGEIASTLESELNFKYEVGVGNYSSGLVDWERRIFYNTKKFNKVLDIGDIDQADIRKDAKKTIQFNYDYDLGKGSSNSIAPDKGMLTLKSVNFLNKGGVQLIPSYKFNYYDSDVYYDKSDFNAWGYHDLNPKIWSLKDIETPLGAKIIINYESDDYFTEASINKRVFYSGLKYSFSSSGNNLQITVENDPDNEEIIDFTKHFDTNSNVPLDLWICRRHEYYKALSCEARIGSIDVNENINVVSVSSNTLILETNISYLQYSNGGDSTLLQSSYTLDAQYGGDSVIVDEKPRGECPEKKDGCINVTDRLAFEYKLISNSSLNNTNRDGGGLRVNKLTLDNHYNNYSTEYYYNKISSPENPNDDDYQSSGVTSFTPSFYSGQVDFMTELPTPKVTYEYVTVKSINSLGSEKEKEVYKFNVLKPYTITSYLGVETYSFGEALKISKDQNSDLTLNVDGADVEVSMAKYSAINNLSSIGTLIEKTTYNSLNQKLYHLKNTYRTNMIESQGSDEESISMYKKNYENLNLKNYIINTTSKVNLPTVLESTTTTQAGFTSITTFNKYDFLTGQVLETTTVDSKDNEFKTELIPAYTIFEYSGEEDLNSDQNPDGYGMGSKVDNPTNKNMLTQEAMTKTYLKAGTEWKETGVGITTWNNQWTYTDYKGDTNTPTSNTEKIWRKHKSFIWDGDLDTDGTYLGFSGDDDNFNWTLQTNATEITQSNSKWKNISTTTQYDHFSAPLEVRDINDNYAATKMCDDNSKVLAVSNAPYTEMYYSGAEYYADENETYFDGQVKASVQQDSTYPHTGFYSIIIGPNQKGFEVNLPDNPERTGLKSKFKVSVWATISNFANARININGVLRPFNGEQIFAGDWVQLNHYEELSTGQETVYVASTEGKIRYDDFRLYPIASSMTSYVYNQWDELWYIIGNNGLASKFEYDAVGRLLNTYTEVEDFNNSGSGGFKKIAENRYNYKNQ